LGARGRHSSAELSVVAGGVVSAIERPAAPGELTDEQQAEWRSIVGRMPADWFPRETWALLAQYCRHVVAAKRIGQLIEQAEADAAFDLDAYDKLLKMQEREGRAMSSLATRMRLTQQSTVNAKKQKPVLGRKPWDVD
jgi:hypothetical protein